MPHTLGPIMTLGFAAHLRLSLLLCGVALTPPAVAQPNSLVDDYLRKSGLDHVIGQIEGGMLRGIDRAQAKPLPQPQPKLSPDQLERLRSAVKVAYEANRLMASVRTQLVALLPSGDTELMLKWLDTPLGKRVTAIETAGSTPEAAQRASEIAPKILAEMAPSRRNDLERLLNASGAAGVSTAIVLGQQVGIDVGMAQASGKTVSDALLRNVDMDRYRRAVAEAIAPELLVNAAAAYAPLSDEELRQYANALDRASPRRVLEATSMAFEKALVAAAVELRRKIAESTAPVTPAS